MVGTDVGGAAVGGTRVGRGFGLGVEVGAGGAKVGNAVGIAVGTITGITLVGFGVAFLGVLVGRAVGRGVLVGGGPPPEKCEAAKNEPTARAMTRRSAGIIIQSVREGPPVEVVVTLLGRGAGAATTRCAGAGASGATVR